MMACVQVVIKELQPPPPSPPPSPPSLPDEKKDDIMMYIIGAAGLLGVAYIFGEKLK